MKFPGALSLVEQLDQIVLVLLRDGRHLVGKLTSFDQFSNIVLEDTKEWFLYKDMMSEELLGCFIIRSDNVVLISQLVCNVLSTHAHNPKVKDESKLGKITLRKVPLEELNQAREEGDDEEEQTNKYGLDFE